MACQPNPNPNAVAKSLRAASGPSPAKVISNFGENEQGDDHSNDHRSNRQIEITLMKVHYLSLVQLAQPREEGPGQDAYKNARDFYTQRLE